MMSDHDPAPADAPITRRNLLLGTAGITLGTVAATAAPALAQHTGHAADSGTGFGPAL